MYCIVKTNKGHEKRNAFNTFTVISLLLALGFITDQRSDKQEAKIDQKIADNKFIHGSCRFPKCALMSIHFIFIQYSVCFHLVISTV